jgi:uncharacterized protein YjdB
MLTVTAAQLTSITVSPPTPTIPKGTTQQFTASGIYGDGSKQDLTNSVTWGSSAMGVATVANASGTRGLASAVAPGMTTITAAFGGTTGTASLTVTQATLNSLAVAPAAPMVAAGTKVQFSIVGSFSDGSMQDLTTSVTWSSSQIGVAVISNALGSQGFAATLHAGTTTITGTGAGGVSGSATLTVTAATLTKIAITPPTPSLSKGTSTKLTATGSYSDGSTQDVTAMATWSSSDGSVASVASGMVSGVGQGTSTISAAVGSISGSTTVTVTSAILTSIAVGPSAQTILRTATLQLMATGTFSDNSTQDLTSAATWSASGTGVASVSSTGHVTGLSGGTSTISATLSGVTGSTSLTVQPFARPFGSHSQSYAAGALKPSGQQTAQDAAVAAFYDTWKSAYVQSRCPSAGLSIATNVATTPPVVSVDQGHGMMITALMAGHDPDAQKTFDSLYGVYKAFPSVSNAGTHLMAWSAQQNCTPLASGGNSVTQADLDIAFALLLANAQWGSAGTINYSQAATAILADIVKYELNQVTGDALLGDWAVAGDPNNFTVVSSSLIPDHALVFSTFSGDSHWTQFRDNGYALASKMQTTYSALPGFLPDYIINTNTNAAPAMPNQIAGPTDGYYAYEATASSWHLGTDFVVNGDTRAQSVLKKVDVFMFAVTHGTPAQIVDGYALSGQAKGTSSSVAFVGPFGVAAMAGTQQSWLDALWNHLVQAAPENDAYSDSIRLLSMIVMSGNWWSP